MFTDFYCNSKMFPKSYIAIIRRHSGRWKNSSLIWNIVSFQRKSETQWYDGDIRAIKTEWEDLPGNTEGRLGSC